MFKSNYPQCPLAILLAIATVFASQQTDPIDKQGKLPPGKDVLWVDPGDPSLLDFRFGVGGSERQPVAPFSFVNEDLSGTIAKVNVVDAKGVAWNVKFGREASSSTFCTRLLWACGYFVTPEYFIARGRIQGARDLKRASSDISKDGSFKDARFQLRSESPKFLEGQSWKWAGNPFLHTSELQGLKILMLLVSNWDAKDATNDSHGHMDTNLAIFEDDSTGERRYLYANDDWGATLGRWGNKLTWNRWNCKAFEMQTPDFVSFEDGRLDWEFKGRHRKELTDVSVDDVRWLLQYLGRITDAQIRSGLQASGATPKELECYSRSLRERIRQLQRIATGSPARATNAPAVRASAARLEPISGPVLRIPWADASKPRR